MLEENRIDELAVKYQTTKINIYREYIQHVFLSLLYQQKESREILFKGGTALKLVYQSPRYSEDLDFSLGKIKFTAVESVVLEILKEIEKYKI